MDKSNDDDLLNVAKQLQAVTQKNVGTEHSHNPFMCYEEDDFDSMVLDIGKSLSKPALLQKNIYSNNPMCDCGEEMAKFDLRYVCEKCGCVEEILGDDTDAAAEYYSRGANRGNSTASYNTSGASAAPLRIRGPKARVLQRKLIGSTSNYKIQQKRNTVEEMVQVIFQTKEAKIPKDVVMAAAELYYSVQQCEIRRGEVKRGTQAACLYRKCIEHGITRKPKEIAKIFGIPQNDLSFGEKILDRLIAKGMLEANPGQMYFDVDKEVSSFTDRYFEDLGVPDDEPAYKNFVETLIRFTIKKHIADSSVPSSKCAGAIFILVSRRKELGITCQEIQEQCEISKSTFTRFARAVYDATVQTCGSPVQTREHMKTCIKCRQRQQLRRIFKKYNVPLDDLKKKRRSKKRRSS